VKNWQHYWKAILAFFSLVATNAVADLSLSGVPWPEDPSEWGRWLVTVTAGTWLVYQKRNLPKKPESGPPDLPPINEDDTPLVADPAVVERILKMRLA